jgi:hypothetical protein
MAHGRSSDVWLAVGILCDPPVRGVAFDGAVACFVDGAYCFVGEKVAEFGTQHLPRGFWDCYGGAALSAPALQELGWFVVTLLAALAGYPERWQGAVFGRAVQVERESVRRELAQLREIVRRAKAEGRTVASWGE